MHFPPVSAPTSGLIDLVIGDGAGAGAGASFKIASGAGSTLEDLEGPFSKNTLAIPRITVPLPVPRLTSLIVTSLTGSRGSTSFIPD